MIHAAIALMLVLGQQLDNAAVARELKGIEERLASSWKNGDCDAWSALIAPDWSVIHITGTIIKKDEALLMCRTPQGRIDAFTIDDLHVRVFNDSAVITGRTTLSMGGANAGTVRLRFTDVFIRRDGRWRVVASHATRLDD